MMSRWLSLFCLLAFLWPLPTSSAPFFTDRFDEEIENAVKRYWPDLPVWKLWKAQLYQESRLDPNAVSPVGARGLAQFMVGTWDDILRQLGEVGADRRDAKTSIRAGAYYMAQLRHTWRSPRPEVDRQHLAQASYNAGTGSILKAQVRCGGSALYEEIMACLPAVTGSDFSRQTIGYAVSIDRWWQILEAIR